MKESDYTLAQNLMALQIAQNLLTRVRDDDINEDLALAHQAIAVVQLKLREKCGGLEVPGISDAMTDQEAKELEHWDDQ